MNLLIYVKSLFFVPISSYEPFVLGPDLRSMFGFFVSVDRSWSAALVFTARGMPVSYSVTP
jgi:hypothetical protein